MYYLHDYLKDMLNIAFLKSVFKGKDFYPLVGAY